MPRTIPVELGERSYSVQVGGGLLDELGRCVAALPHARAAVVVADATVAGLYAGRAMDSLRAQGLEAALIDFPAGEASKTLATYSAVLDRLFAVAPAIDRRTVIVALGGGVTGDLAGFVAATALRGLRFVQCPTTLLADVDSSVGGKTGLDHAAGKNLIGAFHQPQAVLIDPQTLQSLPEDQLANGLAECVKHAVIRDRTLMEFIEDNIRPILKRDTAVLEELIARNVAIKAAVVSADEREAGQREHLNFGHTIGHAIEACAGYGSIGHGQAVSLGMVAACRLAASRGLIEAEIEKRVQQLLAALHLPVRWKALSPAAVWETMQHDKKARAGQVRMILPVMLGEVAVFEDITPSAVEEALKAIA